MPAIRIVKKGGTNAVGIAGREGNDRRVAKSIWVLGGGRFGSLACRRLLADDPLTAVTIIEQAGTTHLSRSFPSVTFIACNAVAFLVRALQRGQQPDWIIPAIPIHVAFEWLRQSLAPTHLKVVDLPAEIRRKLPHCVSGLDGATYTSYADFHCPATCDEPESHCTVTGQRRPMSLYRLLAGIRYPGWQPVVIRSRQILPGVGGYRPQDLITTRITAEAAAGPVLLATACRCHGVLHAFTLNGPGLEMGQHA